MGTLKPSLDPIRQYLVPDYLFALDGTEDYRPRSVIIHDLYHKIDVQVQLFAQRRKPIQNMPNSPDAIERSEIAVRCRELCTPAMGAELMG